MSWEWLPFELGRPWWLLGGAVAIAITIAIARRSLAGQSTAWWRATLAIRLLLLVALTLALADVRWTWRSDRLTVLFLVDVSASIPAGEVTGEGGVLDQLAELGRLPPNTSAGVILFGADAAVHHQPMEVMERHRVEVVIDAEGTDIAAALRLADATFTQAGVGGGRRIVVISDGNVTRGDEIREGKNLASAGAVIDVLPIDYARREEMLVDSLQVPSEVHPGEPYVVSAVIHAETKARARVQLYENEEPVGAGEIVELSAGKTRVDFQRRHQNPARFRYEVRIFPLEDPAGSGGGDMLAKNNVGHAFTMIRGAARVLFVGHPNQDQALLDALADAQVVVDRISPAALPVQPEEYFLYDAIALSDVAAYELGIDNMRLIHGVVKNIGLGFVMLGGPNSFGAGGYQGTPIEELLPVEMEVKERKVLPNGALALVLHTCEFDQGNMWAKRIATAAIEILNPRDHVGVLLWGPQGQDAWGVPFGPVKDRSAIVAQIAKLQPSDMPSFAPSMQLGLTALEGAPAQMRHMVIISDGDPAPPSRQLLQQFVTSRISVSTVCINPHGNSDTGLMKKIAADTGGRYYLVSDPRKLPQIFLREALQVHRSLIMEEDFTPAIAMRGSETLRGLEEAGLPVLHGYVATTAKTLAETPLVSHHQDPILSFWRYGLGKTAAFTSDSGARWATDWAAWPGYPTFWTQLMRSIARRGGEEIFRIERTVEGDRGKLILDAIDADGHYIDSLAITGRVMSPRFDEEKVELQQTGPGRYEARFNARQSGTYLVSLDYRKTGGDETLEGSAQTGLTVSYPPEFRHLTGNPERLRALAAATNGRVLGWEGDFFDFNLPARVNRFPAWQWLLRGILFLFFLDIFLRRVVLSLAPIVRLVHRLRRRRTVAEPHSSPLLDHMLEKRAALRERSPRPVIAVRAREPGAPRDAADAPAGVVPGTDAPSPEERSKPQGQGEGTPSFTDRLLEAKRRARQDREPRQ